jgi:threonylcarbamoyladenosine tRNA methylthiotransferase MtaB
VSVDVLTFGCRLNAVESEAIRAAALAREPATRPLVVVNTCAVTAEAVRQARQAIRKARRENPQAEIVVTGCAAQIDPGAFATMPEVDRVLGNDAKTRSETWARLDEVPAIAISDIMAVRETASHLAGGFGGRARAFVKVQDGCDHRCTFCIIPFGRGNSRSVPMGATVEAVGRLAAEGAREVVLSGVDLTSWGRDLPGSPGLGRLVAAILKHVPDLPRLRLSSLDAIEVDTTLRDLFASEARLMPHLHLSLQAGDDLILKRMKRRHSRAQAIAFCAELRAIRPDMVFGADIIAGFPTESEAMFAASLDLIEACGLTWLHVFPYSPRPGTPAARMPQVPRAEAKARARRLIARGDAAAARHLAGQIGRQLAVLVEQPGLGRSECFAPVRVSPAAAPGSIISLPIRAVEGGALVA